jgi:hypothetical protein
MYLDQWLANAKKLTPKTQSGRLLLNVFGKSLEWIYSKEYRGGCHDTSAAIYILLSELGLSPVLWIELNNKIYDAAVCMPKVGGVPSSPVFASKDLTTNKDTELIYGVASPVGYDGEAKTILHMTIGEYSEFHADDPNKVWNLTKLLGKEAGKKVNVGKIRKKYSSIRRLERHEPAQGKAL